MEKKPKKFVGLHAHSHFSIGDGLNPPEEHIDFVVKNGGDALAFTDHGNMNNFGSVVHYYEKMKKGGVDFKALPGIEAYFIPSLSNWQKLYDKDRTDKEAVKMAKKIEEAKKAARDIVESASEEKAAEDLAVGRAEAEVDEEMQGGSGVEDEEASKSNKWKNPLFQRNHLVLLPKNSAGLKALFACVSKSYIDGFYRFPRMDFEMLEKHAKGNIIASTACISGDAVLETSSGKLTLKQVVDQVEKGKELFVLSFDDGRQREVFSKVTWGKKTKSNAKILRITLSNGKKIKCTGDHKFYTNHGWLRADELGKYEDTSILNSK